MTNWSTAAVALVGAVVGGATSLAGSLIVNRRVVARTYRRRLFEEVLPPIIEELEWQQERPVELLNLGFIPSRPEMAALERLATIAGRKEESLATRVRTVWTQREEVLSRLPHKSDAYNNEVVDLTASETEARVRQSAVNLLTEVQRLYERVGQKAR